MMSARSCETGNFPLVKSDSLYYSFLKLLAYVSRYTGIEIADGQIVDTLTSLGSAVEHSGAGQAAPVTKGGLLTLSWPYL